jgi:hypothetical protein
MKDAFIFITGIAIGILLLFLLVINLKETADIINIVAIIVNIALAISITYYLPKKITTNRYVTEYFISQLETIRNDYDILIKQIKKGELETHEINKEFKYFSMKLQDLDFFLKNNLKLKNIDLQIKNRVIHRLITGCPDFNNTISGTKVTIGTSTTVRLMNLHKDINHYITETVICVNSK